MSTDDKKDQSKKQKKQSTDEFPIQEYKLVPVDHFEHTDTEDEIDLIELAKTIWDNRTTIYRFVAVGFVLGILVALLLPKEYVSTATLMPEYASEGELGGASGLLKQYGGLIGLSGGTYNSASNAIRVDLYPKIVESLSFQDKMAREPFYFPDEDTTASLYEYYMEINSIGVLGFLHKYTIKLPRTIIDIITAEEDPITKGISADDKIVSLSKTEMAIIEVLREQVTASLDELSGIIYVTVRMDNPKVAASIANYTIEELTVYLTEYRTEKVLRDLDFIIEQLEKAKIRFEAVQLELADFRDSNQGSLSALAKTEEQRLNSEYDISFNVYNTLTQQYEEAKLKVQEETPIFKVLQPVQVPVDDETSGSKILLLFMFLSGVSSVIWIIVKHQFGDFKFSINQTMK